VFLAKANIRGYAPPGANTFQAKEALMVEIHLEESDRLDWALKAFKRKIAKAGILKDLRKKRYYVKPSEARQLKAAAARRRSRTERAR
jgi:small subunit ribosomal protein S21